MKTNLASIETIIDLLREKDHTYRVALQLLQSFNETTKRNQQQQKIKLVDQSGRTTVIQLRINRALSLGDISDRDQAVFNILIKDRISRLGWERVFRGGTRTFSRLQRLRRWPR